MSTGSSPLPTPARCMLSEVILYVADMERAVHFYRDVLGLSVLEPKLERYGGVHWVELDTGACRLCLHLGGTCNAGPDAAKIVFAVDDLEAVQMELTGRGVQLGPIRQPAPHVSACDGTDPFGNPFSLESRLS